MSSHAPATDTRPSNGSTSDQDKVPLHTLVEVINAQRQTVNELTQGLQIALRELQDARGDGGRQTAQVAEMLASRLRHGANPLTRAARDQIRDYSELRSHLGGPQDVGVMVQARIQAILPPHAPIGDPIQIFLENAGTPTSVAFAAPNGGAVRTAEIKPGSSQDSKGNAVPAQSIYVNVPVGAITGPITVVTDQGEPTSFKPFHIDPSRTRGSSSGWGSTLTGPPPHSPRPSPTRWRRCARRPTAGGGPRRPDRRVRRAAGAPGRGAPRGSLRRVRSGRTARRPQGGSWSWTSRTARASPCRPSGVDPVSGALLVADPAAADGRRAVVVGEIRHARLVPPVGV